MGVLSLSPSSPLPADKYSYVEIKMMLKSMAYKGEINVQFGTDKTLFVCGLNGDYGGLVKHCWREDVRTEENNRTLFRYSGTTDKWYVFTIKIDPFEKTIIFIVDGQNIASYALDTKESLPTGISLGGYVGQENDFQGYIDYVRIGTLDYTDSEVSSTSTTFFNPILGGYRLDYCNYFADQCGLPAAHSWCRANGFSSASSYLIDQNVSLTKVIGSGEICQDECDSFKSITCE